MLSRFNINLLFMCVLKYKSVPYFFLHIEYKTNMGGGLMQLVAYGA